MSIRVTMTYWVATALFCTMMMSLGAMYLWSSEFQSLFNRLGFPNYFRIELAVAKLVGAAILLVPGLPSILKEWTYAGFAFILVSAFVAHASSGDGVGTLMAPVIVACLLAVSYRSWSKITS